MTQPDIDVAVDYALAQTGKPYHAYGARFGPDYFDCSGLVIASLRHAGIIVPPGVGNTVDLYRWAQRSGGLVSVDKAVHTRGAIMLKGGAHGYGPLGHTSFSLGDGNEMAAHGTRSGIHPNPMNIGNYQDGFIIPDVDYHLEPPVDLHVIQALYDWRDRCFARPLKLGDRSADVATLNLLLARKGLTKKNTGVGYGKATREGVHHLKQVKHFPDDDGTSFGGPAANALLGI